MMLKKSAITGRLDLNFSKLVVPGIVMLAFIALGSAPWLSSGQIMALFFMQFMPNLHYGMCKRRPETVLRFRPRWKRLLTGRS